MRQGEAALGTVEGPVIHLSANGAESDAVLHALFELGCRISRPFALHRSVSTIPRDGWAMIVGEPPERWPVDRPLVRLGDAEAVEGVAGMLPGFETQGCLIGCALSLLGFEHESRSVVDHMGRTPARGNELVERQIVHKPWLELIAGEAWRRLRAAGCPDIPARHPWSAGVVTLCLTHDVDGPMLYSTFATARAAFKGLGRRDRFERESLAMSLLLRAEGLPDPYFNFELWREFEAALDGRSTFFVYPGPLASAKRHRNDPHYDPSARKLHDALGAVVADGWEVGAHIGIQAHGEPAYREARERLMKIVGDEVIGSRTHYWTMDWQNPYETWRAMADAGYRYDVSLSPLTLGFRAGFMMPICPGFRWGANDPFAHVAVPSAVMDAYAVPRDAGRPEDEIDGVLDDMIRSSRAMNGLLVLDWHERTFINRGAWSGYLGPLCYLLRQSARLGGVRIVTGRDVVQEWRSHVERIFGGVL
jgi:hypothetical protein